MAPETRINTRDAISSMIYRIVFKLSAPEEEVVEFNEDRAPDVPDPKKLPVGPNALANTDATPMNAKNMKLMRIPASTKITKLKKPPLMYPSSIVFEPNAPVRMDPRNTETTRTNRMYTTAGIDLELTRPIKRKLVINKTIIKAIKPLTTANKFSLPFI